MRHDTSPTARALLALEAIQDSPASPPNGWVTHLGVTERAARRYVAILREAECPSSRSRDRTVATVSAGGCACRP